MAKNLTKAEKIKKAKTKRKIKTTTKIIITVFGIAIAIPLMYSLYVGVAFFLFPTFDYNADTPLGSGYSKPLSNVNVNDKKDYVIAYYLKDYWYVIDDTEMLKKYKDKFIIYRSEEVWEEGSNKELYVFRDKDCILHISLDSFVLIYDDFFMNSKKKMTMDEFEAYCKQRQFSGVYIF